MKPRLTFEVYEASEIEVEIHLLQWFPVVQSHAVDKKECFFGFDDSRYAKELSLSKILDAYFMRIEPSPLP